MNYQIDEASDLMKVIRHKGTQAFFATGGWTADFEAAEKFSDTLSVLKAQQEYRLKNVEVVLVMGDKPSPYDVVLHLD
jgi:acid phosphatase class B